jgi:tetratricopeptide (TPR) repeat protein
MNLRVLALAPLLLSLFASGQGNSLQSGVALFQQGNYEGALEQFEALRRVRPADASLENFIGITETKLGRIDAANQDYETAIRLDPRLADPHKNLAFNYLGKGQYELAEKHLKTALALDSADPFIHYYSAILYLDTSRDQEAILHIKPAESLLAKDQIAAMMAIKACLRSNAPEEARKLIQLLEQNTTLPVEQEYEIAELLTQKQMYAESVTHFQRVVDMQPGSWQNKYNLAIAHLRAKQPKQAIPLLDAITAEHATDANLLTQIASAYESAGETQAAIDTYQKAIAADPINPDRYLDCTRLLIDLDRYSEATSIIERGLPVVPDAYPLTIRLGAIAMMQGNREKAREAYRKAITQHPTLALGHVALAQTYMKEGDDQEALKLLTEARSIVPRDFALEYVFGLVSLQLGRQQEALEALKSAETLGPGVVEPHYQLGLLYMKLQQWKDARDEFEQVLKLDPHHAPTYYQLSRTYQRLGDSAKAQEMAKQASLLTKTQREDAIKSQELRFGIPVQN